jgi:putative endonuclease
MVSYTLVEQKKLKTRIIQHKKKVHPTTFTARYNLSRLVYFEELESNQEAILRERRMKKWNRSWKIELIENQNPNWEDLFLKL